MTWPAQRHLIQHLLSTRPAAGAAAAAADAADAADADAAAAAGAAAAADAGGGGSAAAVHCNHGKQHRCCVKWVHWKSFLLTQYHHLQHCLYCVRSGAWVGVRVRLSQALQLSQAGVRAEAGLQLVHQMQGGKLTAPQLQDHLLLLPAFWNTDEFLVTCICICICTWQVGSSFKSLRASMFLWSNKLKSCPRRDKALGCTSMSSYGLCVKACPYRQTCVEAMGRQESL